MSSSGFLGSNTFLYQVNLIKMFDHLPLYHGLHLCQKHRTLFCAPKLAPFVEILRAKFPHRDLCPSVRTDPQFSLPNEAFIGYQS